MGSDEKKATPTLHDSLSLDDCPTYWSRFTNLIPQSTFSTIDIQSEQDTIRTFRFGSSELPLLLLVNAPGTPFLLTSRMVDELVKHFHVVTWENRSGGYLEHPYGEQRWVSFEKQVKDTISVIQSLHICNASIFGLCAASGIITEALLYVNANPRSVFLASPSQISGSAFRTNYQETFIPKLLSLANTSDEEAAAFGSRLRKMRMTAPNMSPDDLIRADICTMAWTTGRGMRNLSLATKDMIANPSPLTGQAASDRFRRLAEMSRVRVLHCKDDPVISYKSSLQAFTDGVPFRLSLWDEGTHFVPFLNPTAVAREIISHCAFS